MKEKLNNHHWHFTSGTPARVSLQLLGLSFLSYSIMILYNATEPFTLIKGIVVFGVGSFLFILREHVSNSDYFKEFAKYAEANLIFQQELPEIEEDEPDGYQ